MIYKPGIELEESHALIDAQFYLNERGNEIILRMSTEGEIDRDLYGGIKKRTPRTISLQAFPIEYSPAQRTLEKAGIKEDVDVLITLATQDFINNDLSYNDIDMTRWEVEIKNDQDDYAELYTIKDKNKVNMFSKVYLNIVLGLVKK